ncbi:MAG: N-acetylgalactosamine-6-sulfatase [Planctomycetaceae bacterium]|nr:N-acetylgalactosamine-6-sulfatase [Planctomycetaceae bacterium]|tara:strand:+ start:367 stop:1893 length:1527 start_codon:yes stop_codon:yes gene_type:complete
MQRTLINTGKLHLGAGLAFLLTLTGVVLGAPAEKPNIILIMADDLGYRELGSYGQKLIKTPHLDQLASEGMRFTRNYSGNAVCAPSRCVLMTGQHPGHAYIRNNSELKPEGQGPIPDATVTMAEVLGGLGYQTGAFGKWGLGGPGSEGDPILQGFDRFFGYNCQRHAHSYYPDYLWSNDKRVALNNSPPVPGHAGLAKGADPADPRSYDQFKGKDYAPDRINEQAVSFIKQNKDKPFFLYYPTVIPHVALHVPDEELEPYLELGWNDPPFVRDGGYGYTPHFTPRAAYAAMITRMDHYIGNILRTVEELGLTENTIVIFTSDNGTTHLKKEVDYDFFESVGELRGLKGSLYEGGIRVPLLVRWPKMIKSGASTKVVTGLEDWLPTLLDLIGESAQLPEGVDGVSIAPALRGDRQPQREFLYREFSGYGGQQAVWMGQWKGIRQRMLRNNPNPLKIELYNLRKDPSESKDVAEQYPEIVAQIREIMKREHVPSERFPIGPLDKLAESER